MNAIRVTSAGGTAAGILHSGAPLTVAAVFERSFYCRDTDDRWFCFLQDSLEPGPLHALSAGWPERLGECVSEGQTLVPHGPGRLATPTFTVEFGALRQWEPTPFPPLNPPLLRDALHRLRQAMRTQAPPHTLAGQLVGCDLPGDEWQKTILTATSRALALLRQWIALPHETSLREAVHELMGLGPGLTPTGDDILAGTLLTLHALGEKEKAGELASAVEARGMEGTNRISLAHMRAAAAGQGAAPFHDILIDLLRGEETFDAVLRRIDAIGHSSGWDILSGIVTTLEGNA